MRRFALDVAEDSPYRAGMSRPSIRILLMLAVASTPAVAQSEGITLAVDRGATAAEVVLQWSGSDPTFEVFRDTEPQEVTDPTHEIAETLQRSFTDTPPAGDLFFYRVGTRPPTHAERITIELIRPNDDPVGRPLPIAAHWNTGRASVAHGGWDPDFMMDFFDAGEFVIPGFNIAMPTWTQEPWSYYQTGLQRARAARLPIYIRFTQWDRPFTDDPDYADLPPADNPNVVDAADGATIVPMSDPEGPIERWQEVGAEWGSLQVVADMQAEYPDPPLVIWLNNFEQPRLTWGDAETSWRYVQNHGLGTSDEDKRRFVGDGWIARDAALFASLKGQLGATWQEVSIPVCYSAFGRRGYGSWSGWDRESLHIPGRFAPWPLAVNGTPSYYVFGDASVHGETDFEADGPQAMGMNWPFMLDEAYRDSPDYFWEVSVYDGGLQRHNWYRFVKFQLYDKARYKGYIRFALWLARPRILREFRLASEDRAPYLEYWDAVLAAVKEVHTDPDLERFWRSGELVVNAAHPHHFQSNLVPGYTDNEVDRNFQLEVSANPSRPWNNGTEIPVWALALVRGEAPQREWLLFAYAPLAEQSNVTITVPGYGDVVVDVPRGNGGFWILSE